MSHKSDASRQLSYLLRHKPDAFDCVIDAQGWVSIQSVLAGLQAKGTRITVQTLEDIVASDAKGRYSYSNDGLHIRANQGHSLKSVNITFVQRLPPPKLYHGTTAQAVEAIMVDGLRPMQRRFVHLTSGIQVAQEVGARRKQPIAVLEVDAQRMAEEGFRFLQSDNEVWLLAHVPAKYLSVVEGSI